MSKLEACIRKGCLQQPFDWEDMYMNTKKQPVTGLQERLCLGDTNKNEARHSDINRLVGTWKMCLQWSSKPGETAL